MSNSETNQLVLAGTVISEIKSRNTPAGIPVTRFTLEHESLQSEAGNDRKVKCRIAVTALGEQVHKDIQGINRNAMIRVDGFISYESSQQMETRLILHAQQIEVLN